MTGIHLCFKTAVAMAVAGIVAGCGGGGDGDGSADAQLAPQVGDTIGIVITEGDRVIRDETRKLYGVNEAGQLSDDPRAKGLLADATVGLTVDVSVRDDPDTPPVADPAQVSQFLQAMWGALRSQHGALDAQAAWAEVLDQDMGLNAVYLDYQKSGLSLAEFVAFYAVLDRIKVPSHDDLVERHVYEWLQSAQTNQRQLIDALAERGFLWADFAQLVLDKGLNFQGIQILWDNRETGQTLGDFLNAVIALPEPSAARAGPKVADPATESAKVALEAAKLQFEIAKFMWKVIEDNKPSIDVDTGNANTSILSASDPDFSNYEYATLHETPVKEVVVCTKVLGKCMKDWAKVKFQLSGTHKAKHPTLGGDWVPSVTLNTPLIWAALGQKVNVTTYVSSVSNLRSKAAPDPYMQITAQMKVNGVTSADLVELRFAAQGSQGFSIK